MRVSKAVDQIVKELQEPFKEEYLEYKVGATNSEKTMGLALVYVQARSIQNRLDQVVGMNNWKTSYIEVQGGFLCSMSLRINGEWIEKQDGAQITEYESVKGGISSAFKRVASSGWGIGRYLYEVESQWYPIRKKGKSYEFTINPKIDVLPRGNNQPNGSEDNFSEKLQKAKMLKLTFGKYSGKTLGEIFDIDKRYFQYVKDNGKDRDLVNACKYLERQASN